MSPLRKKQLAAVVALLIAGGLLSYISFGGIEENLVYFLDADELIAKGEAAYGGRIRLGGLVQEGSFDWNDETLDLKFRVASTPTGAKETVLVHASGAPPQMFREGIGVVVEGTYDGKVFHGDRVLVKHSNEYRPPEKGQEADKVYKTLMNN